MKTPYEINLMEELTFTVLKSLLIDKGDDGCPNRRSQTRPVVWLQSPAEVVLEVRTVGTDVWKPSSCTIV